ncbi:MAG TPA: hypothetical protein PLO33_00665 [Kouleothrix sp.]|uniref:hypothetical protein n=1 Tax=Kouleothrix sp. TaxID=2779161 RepID=UPI002BBE87EE|nr:hypothetical protein [Kouleothrix sp.]HRC74154.1 hypothetical protein [Kouleothrix sp.]
MPGFLLHIGAGVQCFHGAAASAATSNVRVFVGPLAAVTVADLWNVAGCPFQIPVPPGTKPQPCVSLRWAPATRVLINGQPAVVQVPGPGQGICLPIEQIPQGAPVVSALQGRVFAM